MTCSNVVRVTQTGATDSQEVPLPEQGVEVGQLVTRLGVDVTKICGAPV